MLRVVIIVLCLVLLDCALVVRADDPGCYTSGSVAGIVIATVVVTLVMGGLAAAFIWYLWKQRKVNYDDSKSMEKAIMCPPMSPDKQMIARESNDYAFDNPYFKDDETDTANPDAAEKGESGFRKDNGDVTTVQNVKSSNGTTGNHQKKNRPFSSLPFHAVFHPSGKKQPKATTMDDTYISKHLERITVPLRGHDFTGLGFNICGNMRDGIFVKDVLHRGPASESGKIKAGDRIVGVTVSFAAMVYEDALTILSYASPYDVKLEIEKAPATSTVTLPPSSPKRLGASTSFRSNGQRRLFHPLYRSQSIDDLTQIGKDGFGIMNTSGSQRDSSSSATPKRSQSVEANNGGLKTRPAFILKTEETKSYSSKGSRKSSTSSCESTAKTVTPTEKSKPALMEESCTKKEAKSARFRAEQVNVKSEAKVIPPAKPARDSHEEKQKSEKSVPAKSSEAERRSSSDVSADEISKAEMDQTESPAVAENEADVEKPTAPPRKLATPKRRAPAPPPNAATKTETSAVVHQTDVQLQSSEVKERVPSHETEEIPPPPLSSDNPPTLNDTFPTSTESFAVTNELHMTVNEMPVFSSTEKIADPGIGSSDTSSLASGDNSSTKMDKEDQNSSPGKRKASSLGDLTKLERGANKKTSVSSAILERAVSLDFQQSIPGENLTKHRKILRAPAFEDDYLEDREDLSEINGQGLKRWDDGLDKVFSRLPNGDLSSNDALNKENDNEHIDSNYITDNNQERKEIIQNNQEINTNEQNINFSELQINHNESGINDSELQINQKELPINNSEQVKNQNDSEISHKELEISHKESENKSIEPDINHIKTEINHIKTEINHTELQINHIETEINHKGSETHNYQPEINHKESEINNYEPEINHKESKNIIIQSTPEINHDENLPKEEDIKNKTENKLKHEVELHMTTHNSSEISTNPGLISSEIHIDPEINRSEINTDLNIGVPGININPKIDHTEVVSNPEINHTEVNIDVGVSKTEISLTSDTNNLKPDFNTETDHSEIEKIDSVVITKSSNEKPLPDLKSDILVDETSPKLQDSLTFLTSTPVKKVIHVKNLVLDEDDDDIDDVPYLASSKPQERDESSPKYTVKTGSSSTNLYSPVTISIPVIKPDLTHFEKLPSPPPANTHPSFEPSWKMTKTITSDENGKTSLEKITVNSLYKPIFTSKEINNIDEPIHQATSEKLVNGNESDASDHYSTAHENTSTSSLETSSLSVTLSSPIKKGATKTPNTIAGFAKTLIIPGPNDVENLLSLATEPNTPPMTLESPSKALENE